MPYTRQASGSFLSRGTISREVLQTWASSAFNQTKDLNEAPHVTCSRRLERVQ